MSASLLCVRTAFLFAWSVSGCHFRDCDDCFLCQFCEASVRIWSRRLPSFTLVPLFLVRKGTMPGERGRQGSYRKRKVGGNPHVLQSCPFTPMDIFRIHSDPPGDLPLPLFLSLMRLLPGNPHQILCALQEFSGGNSCLLGRVQTGVTGVWLHRRAVMQV